MLDKKDKGKELSVREEAIRSLEESTAENKPVNDSNGASQELQQKTEVTGSQDNVVPVKIIERLIPELEYWLNR